MKIPRFYILGLLICLVMPLTADQWWVETTHQDFVDGDYSINLYASDSTSAAGDGSVELIYPRDIGKDGTMDLVVSNSRSRDTLDAGPAYYAYLYDDAGFVDSLFSYNAFGNLIVDYDNDGNLDIAISAFDDSTGNSILYSRLYYGPAWSSVDSFLTRGGTALSTADLDKDGKLDLVFSNMAGYTMIHYQGSAQKDSLPCPMNYGNALADVNDDGELDVTLAGERGIIYYGPDFASADTLIGIDSLTDVTVADVNQDMSLDLLFSAYGDTAYLAYGPDFNTLDNFLILESRGVSCSDLDEDGNPDVIFSSLAGLAYIYFGPDPAISPAITLPTHRAMGNVVGDFNGDRFPDVCFMNWLEDASFDTYSYIYWGPVFGSYDSIPCHGANMSTAWDAGNLYDRSGEEIYVSSVYDAGDSVAWDSVTYTASVPLGSDFLLEIQTGNVPEPDTSWSEWLDVADGDTIPDSLASRYIRYRGTLLTDFLQAPRLEEVGISYPSLKDAASEEILSPNPPDVGDCATRPFLFQIRNQGNAVETIPVHCILDSLGTIVFDSIQDAVDVEPGDSALVMFGGVYCCPGETLLVICELEGDVAPENDTIRAHLGPVPVTEDPTRYRLGLNVLPGLDGYRVEYTLPASQTISLACYDASGRLVKVLHQGATQKGIHSVIWDRTDQQGQEVGNGVYFVKLQAQARTLTRKIFLVH